MIASVVVDCKIESLNRTFDYLVPPCFLTSIKVGQRVYVPFGKQNLLGIVIELKEDSDVDNLKEIYDILDLIPPLNDELISLAKNMHEYYFSLFISCLLTMIPQALRVKYEKEFICSDIDLLPLGIRSLFKDGKYVYKTKDKEYLPILQRLMKEGKLTLNNNISDKANIKEESIIKLNDITDIKLNPKQEEIILFLKSLNEDISRSEFIEKFSVGRLNTLLEKGILSQYKKEVYRHFDEGKVYVDKNITFNYEQEKVYEEIKKDYDKFNTILLHGITGSGKTEIYLKCIEDVIAKGKTAILLVPEISLTPQIVARFKARFSNDVAVLHSRLSIGEKYDEWRRVLNEEVKIVVGARSAIFAPLKNIGIIIIDEEHETSYIQDSMPRYDAKMIARIRARNNNAVCLLGSATPSIESYYKAEAGVYKLLELNVRANKKQPPSIKVIDMADEIKKSNYSLFSNELKTLIKDRLDKKQQIILLINRRGFSSFVMCRECGEVIKCPHCDVSLTYHKVGNKLKCHYCGFERDNVSICQKCGSKKIRFVGGGTQKVVEEINKLFPEAKVLRMDMDNTKNKGGHEKIIDAFLKEEADILVGTQMVAKGLDFPKVSLVGILNCDLALKYPSYTSPALAYNLFVQVSGRAGRHATDGVVIMQTYDTTHYAILNASSGSYQKFYKEELQYRKLGNYPPYKKIIEITVIGKDYKDTFNEANEICNFIKTKSSVMVLGPAEDYIVKINDLYHFKLTIKYENDKMINDVISSVFVKYENSKEYKIYISRK